MLLPSTSSIMIVKDKRLHLSAGFSLLETLVALVIISLGLLGIAALQTTTLKNTRTANIASQATISAHDLIERMRANPMGMQSNVYNNANLIAHPDCYTTKGCSTTELAENDLYEWSTEINKNIPQSSAIICLDSTPNDGDSKANAACDGGGEMYAIKIWIGERNTPDYQRFITTVIF